MAGIDARSGLPPGLAGGIDALHVLLPEDLREKELVVVRSSCDGGWPVELCSAHTSLLWCSVYWKILVVFQVETIRRNSLLSKEGWLRSSTKCREATLASADGVVRHVLPPR